MGKIICFIQDARCHRQASCGRDIFAKKQRRCYSSIFTCSFVGFLGKRIVNDEDTLYCSGRYVLRALHRLFQKRIPDCAVYILYTCTVLQRTVLREMSEDELVNPLRRSTVVLVRVQCEPKICFVRKCPITNIRD